MVNTLLGLVGKTLGAAFQRRKDFDFQYLSWGLEGRDLRLCECGRCYKRLGWAYKHFFRLEHQPNMVSKADA